MKHVHHQIKPESDKYYGNRKHIIQVRTPKPIQTYILLLIKLSTI